MTQDVSAVPYGLDAPPYDKREAASVTSVAVTDCLAL